MIQGLEPLSTFRRKDGSEGRLLKVRATDEEGVPIAHPLKTFQRLPVGKPVDVEVRTDDHPQYGRSYIVSLPRSRTQQRLDDHDRRIAALEQRVGFRSAA